ncbi:flagellar filament capping protein FliD [Clostridium culturomicium]|uniref:flagellar filament capping protein FliD n=1 Tax=Clostridium culturomicium TaxID=1499683 RepID=UPI00058BDDB6|nr:flagellar filament capping protein FliD [Clostridium culturomicium]
MTSVNSVRIPGLATGMDTDQMIKDMLTGEQNKIDKAQQTQQINKWKQEIYRDVIKDVKGLQDKYFSATSPDYILSSKVFSTLVINSSNSGVISATAGAGASNVNYKFKVEAMANPPRLESNKLDKNTELVTADTTIKINDKEIQIKAGSKVSDVVKGINDTFKEGDVKATYSEMTGKLTIEGKKTGESSELKFDGDLFNNIGMTTEVTGLVKGSNNKVTVFSADGKPLDKVIQSESNTFTIDNVTYSVSGVSDELISMTSTVNTQGTTDKMKAFIEDYNKIMDKIYDLSTEKKNKDYPPLTEAQKKEMDEKEIERWEEKAKAGILRNDSDFRSFMEGIKGAILGQIGDLGIYLSDIGIASNSDYNKPGQLVLDATKFKKALENDSELVYKAVTTSFGKIKDITYNYAGSSTSIFAKKAGIEKTASAVNNLFSEQIRRQEQYIKDLTSKMSKKENQLYMKFANLESSMNKLNAQMNYLMSQN